MTKTRWMFLSLMLVATLFSISRTSFASPGDCTKIKTKSGLVTGVLDSSSGECEYKGIPYAAPPVGDLRWAMPRDPAPWKNELIADRFRDECMQVPFSLLGSGGNIKYEGSEDCLYLNVWQPAASAAPRPVMVFIHGGSFLTGAGSLELYDGKKMASQGDVILVTINYRLGVFGMLAHPVLRDRDGYEGNYTLFDQIAALKWVQKNIAAFGGDPANVTLFGESAGGMSVAVHLLSPLSKGLFRRAIIESGPHIFMGASRASSEKTAQSIAEKMGCGNPKTAAACMRKASSLAVMEASRDATTAHGGTVEVYDLNPMMDDRIIFTNPYKLFADGKFDKSIEIIIGGNRDEAAMSAMSRPLADLKQYETTLAEDVGWAVKGYNLNVSVDDLKKHYPTESFKTPKLAYVAEFTDMVYACPAVMQVRQMAAAGANVRQYLFDKSPDERGILGDIGVFHAAELPFVFGNFTYLGMSFSSSRNVKLSRSVIQLWTSFARNGIPKADGMPEWPPNTPDNPAYLRIGMKPEVGMNLKKDACDYFDGLYKKAYGM